METDSHKHEKTIVSIKIFSKKRMEAKIVFYFYVKVKKRICL